MLQVERGAAMTGETALCTAVSDALWLQREILQNLLYRLVCEKLVLISGSHRWLARADDDVRAALEQLRGGEVIRAAEVEELTRILGLDTDASLAEIAGSAPEPWDTLLADHGSALRALAFEVQCMADENRRLAGERVSIAQDMHAVADADAETDIAIYQVVLRTTADVRQLSLIDFLR